MLHVCLVLPRHLSFNFVLHMYFQLEVDYKMVRVVLKVLKFELRELIIVNVGFPSLGMNVVSVMLHLSDMRKRPQI